ncbi:MAG: 2-dehydropantoate 2-reductase [Lachnospiraceae bacterium]|nr:2-dehydropantoate 2-reductase [Lachnospiraceae bacterium]
MKYLIIGAGGTGGCIGAYMTVAGKDVTMIARGAHLAAMQEKGLSMETTKRGNYSVFPVKAYDMENYMENCSKWESSSENSNSAPDVIFVCVKGYSLAETVPFIRRVAKPETVVIPILNIYGTGARLQEELPELLVTDGCIYIAAQIKAPGCLWQNGNIFRVVYGLRDLREAMETAAERAARLSVRDGDDHTSIPVSLSKDGLTYGEILEKVKRDLEESGIEAVLSPNIRRDALQKFSYVSPAAACGQYYNAMAGDMQKPGEIRDTFVALIGEISDLAEGMGIPFEEDMVKVNLDILDNLTPEASTSMQRDVAQGKASEMDGLIFEVVRMGEQCHVKVPTYEKIAAALRAQGY